MADCQFLSLTAPILVLTLMCSPLPPEQYDAVMDVNLKGTYFCCQQAAHLMKEGGSIVIVGSVHYRQAIWGRSLYAASKGGLASLVRSMAYELGPYGIRANYVVAGAIRTERWDDLTPEQIAAKRKNWPLAGNPPERISPMQSTTWEARCPPL